jgi:bifunctional DNase/RNase
VEAAVPEIEVEVWRLVQDESGRAVVVLRDEQRRHLPIWIGPCEASAIWLKLDGARANGMVRRPLTHDLCVSIIERLGGRIERIVIDDFSNDTYYAKIHFAVNGRSIIVDSRPSDAIALALRCDAPVWVSDEIMETGNVAIEEEEAAPPGESAEDEPNPWAEDEES